MTFRAVTTMGRVVGPSSSRPTAILAVIVLQLVLNVLADVGLHQDGASTSCTGDRCPDSQQPIIDTDHEKLKYTESSFGDESVDIDIVNLESMHEELETPLDGETSDIDRKSKVDISTKETDSIGDDGTGSPCDSDDTKSDTDELESDTGELESDTDETKSDTVTDKSESGITTTESDIDASQSDTAEMHSDTDKTQSDTDALDSDKDSPTSDAADTGSTDVTEEDEDDSEYEFPQLTRVEPGKVGDEVQVELDEGVMYTRITKSVLPPVFEIPNFLSDAECDMIMDSAVKNGLNISNLFGADIYSELDDEIPLENVSRVSEQTWLDANNLDNVFLDTLHNRLAKLTELPVGVIQRAEPMQVVSYVRGGHYHAHLDTIDGDYDKPCCFQTRCDDKELTPAWKQCCRICRYITVLYYLNEPEEGGETAFPVADMAEDKVEEKFVNLEEQDWYNLSYFCYNSSLVVKPKRGTAIMWYNHFIDEHTGYLGLADRRSHHGGCDLKRGTKWIANNWISGTTPQDRFKPTVFYTT